MRPRVIAHRGASHDLPENTLPAFDEALRQGCDALELDVQLSLDGIPVVWHDRTLARAGGGRRRVAQLLARQIKELDPGQRTDPPFRGAHVPTLEQVLRRYARKTRFLVELKTAGGRLEPGGERGLVTSVTGLIREVDLLSTTMLLCFDPGVLAAAAAAMPQLPRALNLSPPPWATRRILNLFPTLSALSCDVRTLTPAFGRAVRRAGRELLVYTCNTPARVTRALLAGATGIMSDRPGWLGQHLRDRGVDGA